MRDNEICEMLRLIGRADLVFHLEQADKALSAARDDRDRRWLAALDAANAHMFDRWARENPDITSLPAVSESERPLAAIYLRSATPKIARLVVALAERATVQLHEVAVRRATGLPLGRIPHWHHALPTPAEIESAAAALEGSR
jgi:hypothetical protein